MAERRGWTRDQLLIALRLYLRTPFGKLHGRNREIIRLADHIGRTPNALAMKACNFASLDPVFRASNRKGLSGASDSDRAIWGEFSGNAEALAAEAEEAAARFGSPDPDAEGEVLRIPSGATETVSMVRVRRVQSFFRAAVLTSYGSRCAISGIAVPELLVASHLIPWSRSIERRADPTNGICLNALFDRAFDRGFITVDDDLRVVVSARLAGAIENVELDCSLRSVHGRPLRRPVRLAPDVAAMTYHRENIFLG